MILKGSQRGNALQLARHLLNVRDNEHIELHELRGFVSDDLAGAMLEAAAIAKGTRCTQHLFSLSFNPPEAERVDIESFEAAIEMAEQKLGLDGQSRAIVFHEKEGRRHAHVVWSRIDLETMTARNLPFFKSKLMDLSRELYLEHCWDMPKGLLDRNLKNPLNFTRDEWQQAKRAKQDPRLLKAMFRECWSRSDDQASLSRALEERGFILARGDRRAVVALDYRGEIFALSRWTSVKAKDIRERIKDEQALPSLDEASDIIVKRIGEKLRSFGREIEARYERLRPSIIFKRDAMMQRHRQARKVFEEKQNKRWDKETNQRAARLPRGLGSLWSRITGRYAKIKRQNEVEAWRSIQRDQAEKDDMIARQLDERRNLQRAVQRMRAARAQEMQDLQAEIADPLAIMRDDKKLHRRRDQNRDRNRDRDDGPEIEL